MSRFTLNHAQKRQIRQEFQNRKRNCGSLSQSDLAQWAKDKLRLRFLPSQPVISRLLSEKNKLTLENRPIQRRRKGAQPHLERVLADWIQSRTVSRQCITGDVIKQKAARLQKEVNVHLSESEKTALIFSGGWLTNFQRRWNLKSRRMYGENADADRSAVSRYLPELLGKIQKYSPDDVWNADETGLCYQMAPDRTISEYAVAGRKKEKVRITVLVCSNASGKEKMPLMIIGKARKPRAFQGKTGQELGFDYWNNKKAWMTSSLFFSWLQRFNDFVGRTVGRKVLLLLDNCSAHGTEETLPDLENVQIMFLPPNTTSVLQPMDAGIIATLKTRYRKLQYERALDIMEESNTNIYKIDQLLAMKYISGVWKEMGESVLHNCWRKTGLLGAVGKQQTILDEAPTRRDERELDEVMSSLVVPDARMSVHALLNSDDVESRDEFSIENMASSVMDAVREEEGIATVGEANSDVVVMDALPTERQQLSAIRTTITVLEAQDAPPLHFVRYLRQLRRGIASARLQGHRQTQIDSFFKKR